MNTQDLKQTLAAVLAPIDKSNIECINTKIGEIRTNGGIKPVFIMDCCDTKDGRESIKYLNCNQKTTDTYTVSHNSDFAKLYRLTTGKNPVKRFSKAQQLLKHFHGCRFFAEYEKSYLKDGTAYLKITQLTPENPILNDSWTATGVLKKPSKKPKKSPDKLPDNYRISTGHLPENYRIFTGHLPDDKTLQPAFSLGLEADFNPIRTSPVQGKTIYPYTHVNLPKKGNLENRADTFHFQRKDESLDEFYDRVIDETWV